MAESDSGSSSSSSSSDSSAAPNQSSADEGHGNEKNVVDKKKTRKVKRKSKRDSKSSNDTCRDQGEKSEIKEQANGKLKSDEGKNVSKETERKSRKKKRHSSSESSTSSSSSGSSSSSTSSNSEGEITSTESSSSASSDCEGEHEKDDKNVRKEKELKPQKNSVEQDEQNKRDQEEKKVSLPKTPLEGQGNVNKKDAEVSEELAKETGNENDEPEHSPMDDNQLQNIEILTTTEDSKKLQGKKEGGEILERTEINENSKKTSSPSSEHESNDGSRKLQSLVIKPSQQHERSSSRSRSNSHEKNSPAKERKRSRTPHNTSSRRTSRSRSREHSRKRHSNSRSRSRSPHSRSRSVSMERRSDRRQERKRSYSSDYERRKSRRSESLERRREERKRRHAERDEQEKAKRTKRDEENFERRQKEISKPDGDPDKVKELDNATVTDPKAKITERQRKTVDLLTSRTGGAYIPPAKLRLMQAEITDKSSAAYQRIAWEALKKSIHGYINKVNVDNIAIITRELLKENIVRGRGLLCRSIIQAQAASPTFTHVYAALVAIINSKFPNIGELLLKRLVIQFKRAFRRNDKPVCLSSSRFIAHLVNQRVAHEILALEILTLLVESPTDDSVEVAIAFLKECGMKLTEVSSKGIGAIFEMLKNILHEGKLDKRVQYMIEVVFQVRKDGFKDHQSVIESLELVEEDDQFTHLLMLDDATNTEDMLNAFKFDEEYAANEEKYKGLSKEILGSDASDSDGSTSGSGSGSASDSSDSDDEENEEGKAKADIIDNTETNLIALRRTIYLTINSSLDYEECAHKLMKMQLKPGQEIELCHMFLDCCAEQRTYEKFYGLLAQRFCSINKIYIEPFEEIFRDTYQTTHRLDTNRLRNVSKFFAHLLFTDAISWDVLECIKLNEDDTTSSSRIFIKILFQELAEYMGLSQLNKKLKDEVLVESLAGLFPKDNPRNTRFSINFFTSIGLGGLTDELRQFLKNAPKSVPAINAEILANKPINAESGSSTSKSSSSSSASSSSNSSSGSSSSASESSSDSESNSEAERKKRKNKKLKKKKSLSAKKEKSKKSKSKSKKKNKKRKNESSSSSSATETDSSSSENTSSSSSSSSDEDGKRKSKKKHKEKEKVNNKSKKKIQQENESGDNDKGVEFEKYEKENGYDVRRDKRRTDYNDDSRRDKVEFPKHKEPPQRRDSEVERRREEREKRHREKELRRQRDRTRSRSQSQTRDRRDDRERRNREYERERERAARDSERRRERKRYEERKSRSRSRSRERSNYVKRERDYDRSKVRNTSKERG